MLDLLERLILDPLSESGSNKPLEITGQHIDEGHGVYLVEHDYPPADRKTVYVGGVSTEGQRKVAPGEPDIRKIPLKVWVGEQTGGAATFPAQTNLASNPSAEVGTTDISAIGATTTTRDTTDSMIGEASFKTVTPATVNTGVQMSNGTSLLASPGDICSGSVGFKGPAGASFVFGIRFYTSGVVFISAATVTFTATGGWQRVKMENAVAPATSFYAVLVVQQVAATAQTFWTDGYLLVKGSTTCPPYFDGDTPGSSWTGTPHASTSTCLAAGRGKRFTAALHDLEMKIAKLAREEGTMKRILPSGDSITFDVQEASYNPSADRPFNQHRCEVEIELTVKPLVRRPERTLPDRSETVLPVLIATESGIVGSQSALARMVVDDDQGVNRGMVLWGIQSNRLNDFTDTKADLFWEAETLTPIGGASSAVAGPTGASGAGANKIVQNTSLDSEWGAILGIQRASDSAYMTHVGVFRVIARIQRPTPAGTISVALEWAFGDLLRFTRNPTKSFLSTDRAAKWHLVDLGTISIPQTKIGPQRWRGQIVAKSTAIGDDIYVDWITLIPVEAGWGEVRAVTRQPSTAPGVFATDNFDAQTAGNLAGKTGQVGGTWAAGAAGGSTAEDGDADDFTIDTSLALASRSAQSDSSQTNGRYEILGTTTATGVDVSADIWVNRPHPITGDENRTGVLARFTDTDNWLMAVIRVNYYNVAGDHITLYKRVAGTVTQMGDFALPVATGPIAGGLRLITDSIGNATVYWNGVAVIAVLADANLATGGALQTGKVGIYDAAGYTMTGSASRLVNNFKAKTVSSTDLLTDAAVFASRSLVIRYDSVLRQDSGGAIWAEPGVKDGDLLQLPPAGKEGRQIRWILLASRGTWDGDDTRNGTNDSDNISAQLFYQPRDDVVPEPS